MLRFLVPKNRFARQIVFAPELGKWNYLAIPNIFFTAWSRRSLKRMVWGMSFKQTADILKACGATWVIGFFLIDELCNQAEEGGRVMCAQAIGKKMFLRGLDFDTVADLTGLMEGEVEYLQLDVQNGCLGS